MGNQKSTYDYYKIENLADGAISGHGVYGEFIILLSYTGSDNIKIALNNNPFQEFPTGIYHRLPDGQVITDVKFKNTSGGAVTLGYALGSGIIQNSNMTLAGTLSVDPVPAVFETPAAAAVTDSAAVVVAADTDSQALLFQNNGGNAIWLGDSNVTPASSRGIKLDPGATLPMETKGAVYARCASGLTSTLSIAKTSKA